MYTCGFREIGINCVNGSYQALKFTWEINEICVYFLTISVSIKGDARATYKRTDSHSYLLFSSSQFLRLRRLCSDDKDIETKSLEMRTFLVERCYPTHLLDSALHAPPPTSFTAFLPVNVANFTLVKRVDVHLTDLLNTFVP